MKDVILFRKGEYRTFAKKDSGYLGELATLNQVQVSELMLQEGKSLLLMPTEDCSVTEFAYILQGCIEESEGRFSLETGESIYLKDIEETIYLRAREDTRMLYLSHENVIQALSDAMKNLHDMVTRLDGKDHYTKSHCARVLEWVPVMARRLNLDGHQLKVLMDAALFHDLGKIEISDEILHKPASLTEEEFDRIKKHPSLGRLIAEDHDLNEVGVVIEQHHERIDGRGYPFGLKGEAIRIEAKIIAVLDSYDAMTSDRPYRKGLTHQKAVDEIIAGSGTHYDPAVVDVFVKMFKEVKEK